MPRSSRKRSHRQNHKESSLDSGVDGSPNYGPRLVPELLEVEKYKDELSSKSGRPDELSSKGGRPDPLKGKREIQMDDDIATSGDKRKSPNSGDPGPFEPLPSKKRRGSVSVSAISLPERWNGGVTEGDALSLLAYLDCSKERDSKADSDSSGRNPVVVEERALRNEEKSRHKLKESEVIPMTDLADSTHIKNRAIRRKENIETSSQGNAQKRAESPLVEVDSDALIRGKTSLAKSGPRLKLDRDREAGKKELREVHGGTLHHDVQQAMAWAKNVQDNVQEKSDNLLSGASKNSRGTGKQESENGHNGEESLHKRGQKSTEWQIQDELRNLELEKELENRILRRREESGERDRQWNDNRYREGKFYHSRENLQRNGRYKDERQRDDKPRDDRFKVERRRDDKLRDDRHKDDRQRNDKTRLDRYKDERRRDENPREDRDVGVRQRYDRHKVEKYKGDSYRADKYRDDKSGEDLLSKECTDDRYDSKNSRDETCLQGHYKQSKYYDSDQEYSSYYDDQYTEHDNSKGVSQQSHASKCGGSRQIRAHRNKDSPCEDDHVGTRKSCQNNVLVQGEVASDFTSLIPVDVAINDNWQKRDRDVDCNSDRHRKRLKDTFEERPWHPRDKQNTWNSEQLGDCSKERLIQRSRNTTESEGDGHGGESPLGSADSSPKCDGCLSPIEVVQGSVSQTFNEPRHPSYYERAVKRKKLGSDNNFTGASGMQCQRGRSGNYPGTSDRGKTKLPSEDEIRYQESRVACKGSDTFRERSRSTDRLCSSHLNHAITDGFSRSPSVFAVDSRVSGSQDEAFVLDCHSMQFSSSDGLPVPDEGPKTFGHSEEMNSTRSGWPSHHTSNFRSAGIPGRPWAPSYPVRPSGHLPPPPPFRPGIDNPATLGLSNGTFEEACLKGQGRGDWKASSSLKRVELNGVVSNWNSQAQRIGSNNIYANFQHQTGGHPSGGYFGMGQQCMAQPMIRGVSPSSNVNYSGVPYHMWHGGDGPPGHDSAFHWHGPANDVDAPKVCGSLYAWDGQASYGGEPLVYGQPGYYPSTQGMSSQCWDQGTDTFKGHPIDTSKELSSQRESGYQGCHSACESRGEAGDPKKRFRGERSPTENVKIKLSDKGQPKIIPKSSHGVSADAKKSNNNGCESIRSYLLHLDISEELAGLDLYNEYVSLSGAGKAMSTCNADFVTDVITDNDQLEVDTDSEALVCSFDMRREHFPTLLDNKAMEIYKKARKLFEEQRVDTCVCVPNVTTRVFDTDFVAAEDSKEDPYCTTENDKILVGVPVKLAENNPSQHDSTISANEHPCFGDAATQIYTEVQEVPKTSLGGDTRRDEIFKQKRSQLVYDATVMGSSEKLLDGIYAVNFSGADRFSDDSPSLVKECVSTDNVKKRESVLNAGKEDADLTCPNDDNRKCAVTVDSSTLLADVCNAVEIALVELATGPEDECSSKNLLKKHGGDGESHSKMIDLETISMSRRFQEGNPVKGDLCGDNVTHRDELLESIERFHEEALIFHLVESKELVSAACIVHTLREVSFHVGCQLFYLYIWLRCQCAMFHIFADKRPPDLNISHLCIGFANLVQGCFVGSNV